MKYDIQKLFNCHSVITGLSGRLGNYVFYMRGEVICARIHVIPANPRTKHQQARRARFAGVIRCWRSLDENDRAEWKARAGKLRRTGYNLFISEHMRNADIAVLPETESLKPMLHNHALYSEDLVNNGKPHAQYHHGLTTLTMTRTVTILPPGYHFPIRPPAPYFRAPSWPRAA